MAHIKCRYVTHLCIMGICHSEVDWNEYWQCDTNDECEHYKRPDSPGLFGGVPKMDCVNPQCYHSLTICEEFERDYKRYKYADLDGLTIGPKWIDYDRITYLEIDGRVLIDEGD